MGYYSNVEGIYTFTEMDAKKIANPMMETVLNDKLKGRDYGYLNPIVKIIDNSASLNVVAYGVKAYLLEDDLAEIVRMIVAATGAKKVSGEIERIGEDETDIEIYTIESLSPVKVKTNKTASVVVTFEDGTTRRLL